jgi:DNA helicase-2/ATP-dependent DNA helicase PcrA
MALGGQTTIDALASLTAAQRDAVVATDSRLVVHAGAGAGKTRVLTLRVARMVDEGIDPSHIMVVTFSRKAAQELRSRLWHLGVEGVRAGTFHRTALELLEVHRAEQGLGPPALLSDRRAALGRLLRSHEGSFPKNAPMALDTEITWGKSFGLTPATYEDEAARLRRRSSLPAGQVAMLWQAYEEGKRRSTMLDFDDLISDAVTLLGDSRFATAMQWRSRHLLIDEFQDVNPMQFALVERMLTPTTTLFCVGDPNQSIYAFNGADPGLLRTLDQRLPEVRTIVLDTNHRSTPEIVEAATSVLPEGERRAPTTVQSPGSLPEVRELANDRAEAMFVAERARFLHGPGGKWRSIAVLARTNAQLAIIAEELTAHGIPAFALGGDLRPASDVDAPVNAQRRVESTLNDDAVALATFHRAKGLEWPYVFVIGASEGFVPHGAADTGAALDEERRLLYVALTRAELGLVVTWAARRDGNESSRAPTRRVSPFLSPMIRRLDELRAQRRPTTPLTSASRVAQIRAQLAERVSQSEAPAPKEDG